MPTNFAALVLRSPLTMDLLFLYLMCTVREPNSNRGNGAVDTSSNQRDGSVDWLRGLRCAAPAAPNMEPWTKPADPNTLGTGD